MPHCRDELGRLTQIRDLSCPGAVCIYTSSPEEGVILALAVALRAPVKTSWKATRHLPACPACMCSAKLFRGLQATDDKSLLPERATLQCRPDCETPFMAAWVSC